MNSVKQSDIIRTMTVDPKENEKTRYRGIRFPITIITGINEIARKDHRDFSKQVIDLCAKGIERYYLEKRVDAKAKKGIVKMMIQEKIESERELLKLEKENPPDVKAQ